MEFWKRNILFPFHFDRQYRRTPTASIAGIAALCLFWPIAVVLGILFLAFEPRVKTKKVIISHGFLGR